MKWELYLTRREWLELQGAVRERATPPGEKRPCCEWCKAIHGRLKRTKRGYLCPMWLHTVHIKGRPLKSKNPADYLALCPKCHMVYDRAPGDGAVLAGRYREGYATTTTDGLIEALSGVGCELWGVVNEGWYWRYGEMAGGPEETPALAAAMVIARLDMALGTSLLMMEVAQ